MSKVFIGTRVHRSLHLRKAPGPHTQLFRDARLDQASATHSIQVSRSLSYWWTCQRFADKFGGAANAALRKAAKAARRQRRLLRLLKEQEAARRQAAAEAKAAEAKRAAEFAKNAPPAAEPEG